jgi:hypothetical protein
MTHCHYGQFAPGRISVFIIKIIKNLEQQLKFTQSVYDLIGRENFGSWYVIYNRSSCSECKIRHAGCNHYNV